MGLCLGSPRRRTQEPEHSVSGSFNRLYNTEDPNCQNLKVYSLRELKAATKNFKPDLVLREGSFGKVYKGWIGDNAVAIKELNSLTARSFLEWKMNLLGGLSHPNLVKLIGYCMEENELLIVSEFMPQGSLEDHLFTRSSTEALSWDQRLKIAIGAARGLAFLHTSDSERPVAYKNFEAGNILLDGEYNAKLSDFGLAKLGVSASAVNEQLTIKCVLGSGYGAPEYYLAGEVQVQNSVYGFGVVLLEMLTGLRAEDNTRPSEQWNLVQWVKPYLSSASTLKQIIDATIIDQCSITAAFRVAQVARCCTASDPKSRPSMEHVIETLLVIYGYHRL